MAGPRATLASARRLLWRDWRGGELGILVAAIVLAVAVVVGISVFVARLQSALAAESTRFLAADLVVRSGRPLPSDWQQLATDVGLSTAQALDFSSMTYSDGDAMVLGAIKAASAEYPLRGDLLVSALPFGPIERAATGPGRGEVWLAPRLFALLEVTTGDTVYVGELGLRVTGAVRGEPDGATSLFGGGPRLLMHVDDIPATGVVQPGSRVTHRLLVAGDAESLARFRGAIEPQLEPSQRIEGLEEGQPRLSATLERARGFLLLAGSLGVVLAAAAVSLAARRFSDRHTDYVAVMKSLGASSGAIGQLYGTSLLILGVLATGLGCFAGWLIQALFFRLFADQLPVAPGESGIASYLIGAATAIVCLLLFAWPPLRRLADVPPLRVLRRDVAVAATHRSLDVVWGGAAIAGLMWWYSGDLRLTAGLLGGLILVVGTGYLAARLLLASGRQLGSQAGSVWRLALAGLQRRGTANALQMTIFAIAIMLLLVLTIVRTSLVEQWAAQLPPGTPNHFMINIAPEQRDALADFFQDQAIEREPLYAMSRGRVMAINGEALLDRGLDEPGPRQRGANFTTAPALPESNDLVAGEWWPTPITEPLVSLEREFAADVGATVGDRLTFRIGADSFDATVANIRDVDWQSMQPNFFVIFPPGMLDAYPQMFMTSFHLPADQKTLLNQVVRRFPTVSVIELDVVIEQIQSIVGRVGQAIQLVLYVILLSGGLVLVAGVQASVDTRLRESALLRALGARSGLLLGALAIEFTVLGAMAGFLAVIGAEAAAWLLQTQALDLRYVPSVSLWGWGVGLGAAVVGALGVLSCRKAVSAPPLAVLREL